MLQTAETVGESLCGTTAISPGLATRSLGDAYELKFQVSTAEAAFFEDWARRNLTPDSHGDGGKYWVTSLYCDTPQLDVFHRSGGFRGRKFRVRRYDDSDQVFLERKSKTGDCVRKRRVGIETAELEHLSAATPNPDWTGYWFHRRLAMRGLRPTVCVGYQRTAFVGVSGESSVRLTLDRNLIGVPATSWRFESLHAGHRLLEDAALLELKFHVALPELFRDLLPRLPGQLARLSKYRRCVEMCGLAIPIVRTGSDESKTVS